MNKIGTVKRIPGFTLIEMIVAVGVFSVMMSVIVGAFSSGALTYRESKDFQRNLESAQYSMNTMAKHLRTSTVVSPSVPDADASEIAFYDYSSNRCFEYRLNANVLEARWVSAADPDDVKGSVDICRTSGAVGGSWAEMTSGEVDGSFRVIPSDDGSGGSKRAGRVTIMLTVRRDGGTDGRLESFMQTSVSLRDYGYTEY